jgi:putative ATP-dependent endonuclease of OLD family
MPADSVRSTLLFAKGIILIEGDAELILIPTLIKEVFGIGLDELGVSLINMSSTVFCNIAALFDDARIRRHCAIITDFDESIVPLPADPRNDDDLQKKCRASQKSGAERRASLTTSYANNNWIKPFYAPHTFEVDFLIAGNQDSVVATLQAIYQQRQSQIESEAKLRALDKAVAGIEVLRLAAKEGKGWFALLLAEHVSITTAVPEYILQAVAFACRQTIDRKTICQMVKFRCDTLHPDSNERRAVLAAFKDRTAEQISDEYARQFPTDVLTRFVELLR